MESISRISGLLESARDLTLDAAQAARSSRLVTPKTMSTPQIKKLLDSRNERDVLDGSRKVVNMMYHASPTQPTLPFFSSIVKNVASPSLEIKKLVYIYLVAHAEAEPDLALLSINTIQKSLSDSDAQVRALALRTMAGIRVPVISQIVGLAIKKGVADMSAHVRKAAALAVPKCYRLDPATLPQLLTYTALLLGDRQPSVAGAAVVAFLDICPERVDLVHAHYRTLVRKLVDMDEWSQLATLRLMNTYVRKCFPRRTRQVRRGGGAAVKGFYEDEEVQDDGEEYETVEVLDSDLELLFKSTKPLLQSRNSAVVVAVARCYSTLGTAAHVSSAIGPLVALLRGPSDVQQIALYNIVSLCIAQPQAFVKYTSHFLVHTTDTPQVWTLKLEVLALIFPYCEGYSKSLILNELEHFSRGSDRDLVRESVRAIGRCAQGDIRTATRCLKLLLKQITSPDGNLVAESLTVIRHLIQQDPRSHRHTVIRLAKYLDSVTDARARATIVWLVGEFSGVNEDNNIAADVLRILAKGFADEAEPAKLQIVLLAAKVYLHYLNNTSNSHADPMPLPEESLVQHDLSVEEGGFGDLNIPQHELEQKPEEPIHQIVLLWNYILLLARYDVSYDLRDRTRLYKALLSVPTSTQLASLILLAPKPVPHTPSPSEGRTGFAIGSASLIVGEDGAGAYGFQGYASIPAWVQSGDEPDPSVRDVEVSSSGAYDEKRVVAASDLLDNAAQSGRGPMPGTQDAKGARKTNGNGKEKTLDDWLEESEEEEESEESEEEDAGETDEDEGSDVSESASEEGSGEDDDAEHDKLVKQTS